HRPLITLTSDFGLRDHYVAAMKAVLIQHCPEARLIDVTHQIPPQDVLCGSITLQRAIDGFPRGTVHLAVIDPGVGTDRRMLLVIMPASPPAERGLVIHIDHFGNATTNIGHHLLRNSAPVVRINGKPIGKLRRTYWDVPPGKPLALIGSSGLLEIAVRDGSAA